MGASIDDVIATAATHLLMVRRHTPEQVADYLVRMADRTDPENPYGTDRWAQAKAARSESLATQ